jgi:hypothetical protein
MDDLFWAGVVGVRWRWRPRVRAQATKAAPAAHAAQEQATSDVAAPPPRRVPVADYPIQEGYIDSGGVLIYYTAIGRGAPIVIVHGGPGGRTIIFCRICCRWRGRTG